MRIKKHYFSYLFLILQIAVLAVIIPFAFAFFNTIKIDDPATTQLQALLMDIPVRGCEELKLLNAVPGDEITCELAITNNTEKTFMYDYMIDENINNFTRYKDLVITVTKNGELKKNDAYPTKSVEYLTWDNCIAPGETDTYVINLKYVLSEEDQLVDRDKEVSAKVGVRNIEFVDECYSRAHTLTINPLPGSYDGKSEKITTVHPEGDVVAIHDPEPLNSLYTFTGWTASDGNTYTDTVTINGNLTLIANWSGDLENRVCYIIRDGEELNFPTIQACNDAAKTGETIYMAKSTTESPTMNKDVTLDLNGFDITGTITNTGNLTIIGQGTISGEEYGVVNEGTITLGEDDGIVSIEYPHIEGGEIGLQSNNNRITFYDGIVKGKTSIIGRVTKTPVDYHVFKNFNNVTKIDSAYLVPDTDTRAICRIQDEYYFNFQKALEDNYDTYVSSNDPDKVLDTIYFIRDAELAYPIEVHEGIDQLVDIDGYTITSGFEFINNGKLRFINSKLNEGRGAWDVSVPIVNNNELSIKDFDLTQSTNTVVIENHGKLDLKNATITGFDTSAIYQVSGTLDLDSDSEIVSKVNQYGINCEGGTLKGQGSIRGIIKNSAGICTINGPEIYTDSSSIYAISAMYEEIIIDNAKIRNHGTATVTLIRLNGSNSSNRAKMTINNIDLESDLPSNYIGLIGMAESTTLIINNGNFKGNAEFISGGWRSNITINNGTFETSHRVINNGSGSLTINNGNFTCTGTEDCVVANYFMTINDGNFVSENILLKMNYHVTINGGNFTSNNGNVISGSIFNNNRYTLYINGGTLHALNDNAISTNYKMVITDGTIISDTGYGIYDLGSSSTEGLTIGTLDGNIDYTTPKIIGATYGVYNTNDYVEMFDGTLYGKTAGSNVTLNKSETGYALASGTGTYNGETYQTSYIDVIPPVFRVDSDDFIFLNDAISAAEASPSKTIQVIGNATYTEAILIDSEEDLIFDLNGKELNITNTFKVNSNLTIIDSSGNNSGKLVSNQKYTLQSNSSNSSITINGGTFETNYTSYGSVVIYGYNITINGGSIINTNGNGVEFYGDSGITDGSFTTKDANVYFKSGTGYISGGTYNSTISNALSSLEISNITMNLSGTNHGIVNGLRVNGTITVRDSYLESDYGYLVGNANASNDAKIKLYNNTIIKSDSNTYGAYYINGGNVYQYSGTTTVNSNTGVSIFSNSKFYMIGGTLKVPNGKGIDLVNKANTTEVIIGEEGGGVSESPVIITRDYVLDNSLYNLSNPPRKSNARISFYDGILKSQNDVMYEESFYIIESGYKTLDGTEVIDGVTYNTKKLMQNDEIISVNGTNYRSLKSALASVPLDGTPTTMTLLVNLNCKEDITLSSDQNVIFDLNGYSFTTPVTWDIKGKFEFTNNKPDSTSTIIVNKLIDFKFTTSNNTITFRNINIIYNCRDFNVGEVLIKDTGTGNTINYIGANLTYTDNGNEFYSGPSAFNITNSTFNTSRQIKITSGGTFNMSNSTFSSENAASFYIGSGATGSVSYSTIDDTYSGYNSYGMIYVQQGTLNISNTSFTNNSRIYNDRGTLTITDSTADSTVSSANKTFIENKGTLNITNTNITTQYSYGINNNAGYTVNFVSGSINSHGDYGVYNSGTLNIGNNENAVVLDNPSIKGNSYGVYNNGNGKTNFYDGIIKGQAGAIFGAYDLIYPGYSVSDGSEVITENSVDNMYLTNYLDEIVPFVSNNGTPYTSLALAVSEAASGDTLTFIHNAKIFEAITIPSEMELTFDYAGYDVQYNYQITNNGTLNLIDNTKSSNIKFNIASSGVPYIINNHVLVVDGGNYDAAYFIKNNTDITTNLLSLSVNNINYVSNYNWPSIQIDKGRFEVKGSVLENTYTDHFSSSIINTTSNNVSSNDFDPNVIEDSEFKIPACVSCNYSQRYCFDTIKYNLKEDFNIINSTIGGTIYVSNTQKDVYMKNSTIDYRKTNNTPLTIYNQVTLNIEGTLDLIAEDYTVYYTSGYNLLDIQGKLIGDTINAILPEATTVKADEITGLNISGAGNANLDTLNIIDNNTTNSYKTLTGLAYKSTAISKVGTINYTALDVNNAYRTMYGVNTNGTGTLDITNLNVNMSYADTINLYTHGYGIYNSSTVHLNVDNANINVSTYGSGVSYGTAYGIYNNGAGTITIKNGTVTATNTGVGHAYGIYTNVANGSVVLGTYDGVYHPDIITVKGIANNGNGIGVQKVNGYFEFYDGTLIGSTSAKPDTTSLVEEGYEAVFETSDGLEYCTLDFLTD